MVTQSQLLVPTLGPCTIPSPLANRHASKRRFMADDTRVLFEVEYRAGAPIDERSLEKSGPREKIFFEPAKTKAAIVTCGGLCPGINNVIRNLYYTLKANYGVQSVIGIRNGYEGLNPAQGEAPCELTDSMVEHIHHRGGTVLGTSRGPQDPVVTVNFLESMGVDILFTIGGDGTQRGAHAIAAEVTRRGAKIAVVGIPKTIDNDIKFCYQTFGFLTAVAEAEKVIDRAHIEATSMENGVGLVKLMGREAGFIAAAATIASGEVNFTLIPEAPFELAGPRGFLPKLAHRLRERKHAVVVVAEGAGQEHLADGQEEYDASGNRKLDDIGPFLKGKIEAYCREVSLPVGVKYFDPSYFIRSAHADAADSLLTEQLSRHAVHAAMAGKTDMFVGLWHNHTVHVPLALNTGEKKRLETDRDMWAAVLAITGQEDW